MIKLSLVKKFGIELVNGDMITSSGKSGSAYMIGRTAATYFNGTNNEDYRRVESFATRLISDGIPASIDGDVLLEITNGNGLVLYISASNIAWHVWTTWRPSMEWLMQQAADKPVTYKDDTQHFGEDVFMQTAMTLPDNHQIPMAPQAPKVPSDRMREALKEAAQKVSFVDNETANATVKSHIESMRPVFTQAMADAGELPPVGSYVLFEGDNVLIQGYAKSGYPIFEREDGMVDSFTAHSKFKPLDNRSEKEKAVDAAFLAFNADKDTLGSIYDYWMGGDFKK